MDKRRQAKGSEGVAESWAKAIDEYKKSLHSSHVAHQKGLLHPSYKQDGIDTTISGERPSNNVQSSPKIGDSQHSFTKQNAHLPHLPVLQQSGI